MGPAAPTRSRRGNGDPGTVVVVVVWGHCWFSGILSGSVGLVFTAGERAVFSGCTSGEKLNRLLNENDA